MSKPSKKPSAFVSYHPRGSAFSQSAVAHLRRLYFSVSFSFLYLSGPSFLLPGPSFRLGRRHINRSLRFWTLLKPSCTGPAARAGLSTELRSLRSRSLPPHPRRYYWHTRGYWCQPSAALFSLLCEQRCNVQHLTRGQAPERQQEAALSPKWRSSSFEKGRQECWRCCP